MKTHKPYRSRKPFKHSGKSAPFVVSLSNRLRKALRQAQGERKINYEFMSGRGLAGFYANFVQHSSNH